MRLRFQGSDGPDGSNTMDSWTQGLMIFCNVYRKLNSNVVKKKIVTLNCTDVQ